MSSLKRSLGSYLLVALLLVFGCQWLLVSFAVERVTENYIAGRLSNDIDSLLAVLSFNQNGQIKLQDALRNRYDTEPYSGHYFVIQTSGSRKLSRSLWDQELTVPFAGVGATVENRLSGPLEQPLLVISKGFNKLGRHVSISVAEDITPVQEAIRTFQWRYLLLSLVLMLLLLVAQLWIISRSLSPLTKARLDLEKISNGKSTALNENVPDEVRPLVEEINVLLNQLTRRLNRTRTAVGNLAHELKTPLSLINQMINDPRVEKYPELKDRLEKQVQAIRLPLERELGRARVAGDGKSGPRFNPGQDLQALIKTLKQLHSDKTLDIDVQDSTALHWPFDREDMLELTGNLADNACKWARHRIRIVLSNKNQYSITIEDDGSGCSPEKLDAISQRGLCLDESVEGHGLGLSIASEIVNNYGGQLLFDQSTELGGLKVSVSLGSR